MKVNNEKKGIFSFFFTYYGQNILMRAIFITVDLTFWLKVSVINKSKDTDHENQ